MKPVIYSAYRSDEIAPAIAYWTSQQKMWSYLIQAFSLWKGISFCVQVALYWSCILQLVTQTFMSLINAICHLLKNGAGHDLRLVAKNDDLIVFVDMPIFGLVQWHLDYWLSSNVKVFVIVTIGSWSAMLFPSDRLRSFYFDKRFLSLTN